MITITMSKEDASKIYKALKNHCMPPDEDQRAIYNFVHLLDKLIDESLMTHNDVKGQLD
jgi:hypothetical protein